jgi:purine nucleosidase
MVKMVCWAASVRYTMRRFTITMWVLGLASVFATPIFAQNAANTKPASKIILDTDIGDDIDDAFALALALRSPELDVIGITTAWGDTALRAKLANRLVKEGGGVEIPVLAGLPTPSKSRFTQSQWANEGEAAKPHADAVEFLLEQAKKSPGEVTLVAVGPLTNLGAAIDRDADGFRKFKRVVLMGGSIRRGYGDLGFGPDRGPEPEYNIYCDVKAAQKLFASSVPIFMMPLDSTQLLLDENKRTLLFSTGSQLTNALAALYFQWVRGTRTPTATLFDVMAVAYAVNPQLCPTETMHITVDEKGMTKPTPGAPNAAACLASDSEQFFHFVLPRLMAPKVQSAN